MLKIIKTSVFALAFFLVGRVSFAFTIPETNLDVGMPVFIEETEPLMHYAVFLPFEEPTNGEVCASITGEQLAENNNLRNYGTCFINDEGNFTIVEIAEPFASSYENLKETDQILQEEQITLVLPEENKGLLDFLNLDGNESTSSTESITLPTEIGDYILGAKTSNLIRKSYFAIVFILFVTSGFSLYVLIAELVDRKPRWLKKLRSKLSRTKNRKGPFKRNRR